MSLGIISRALAAAAADGSLADFYSDLVSCGGRVVAGMLEEAVEAAAVGREEDEKKKTSSAAAATASAAAAAAGAASYERLHSGPWHAVPAAWRDAYSLACLLQVADAEGEEGGEEEEEGGGDDSRRRKRERLRLLDLALLLGGRRFRAPAHAAAAALSAALRETSSRCSSSPLLPEAWPLPATPVELPAGSLGASEMGERVEAAVPPFSSSPPPPPPLLLLSLEDFVARATAADPAPFVLPSCVSSWPALSRWSSPRYWDRVAGERTVPVEVGESYLEGDWSQELQTLRAFLDDHVFSLPPENAASSSSSSSKKEKEKKKKRKTGYLAQHDLLEQVPELARDVLTPDYVLLSLPPSSGEEGEDGGEGVARNLWLGPARTLSPLHTDPKRNLLCQVFGKKYVRLYRPDERSSAALLQAGREGDGREKKDFQGTVTDELTAANTSRADLFSPPETVAALRFVDVVLNPGDALFIPKGWWHFVLSLEPSASVSFWF